MKSAITASLAGCAFVLSAVAVIGCGPGNQARESSDYAKLPPGEGEKRLKETLAKRSGAQPQSPPATKAGGQAGPQ